LLLLVLLCPPPSSTLFPYTTLFRSLSRGGARGGRRPAAERRPDPQGHDHPARPRARRDDAAAGVRPAHALEGVSRGAARDSHGGDRKSTRLNSSHVKISYAVFCLKK